APLPACRLLPRTGLGGCGGRLHRRTESPEPRRLLRLGPRRRGTRGAPAGAHRRLALPGSGAPLRRPGAADRAHALRRGRRLPATALDGGCRSGAPPWPATARPYRRALSRLDAALPRRRLSSPAVTQSAVPLAL